MTDFAPIKPQNVDLSVSARDYKDLPDDHLWVHGEFFTLQGEGPFAGQTAYFVRLAGCNYGDKDAHCRFCDTSFHFENGKSTHVSKIYDRFVESQANVLVVTGGEPLLQVEGLSQLAGLCYKDDRIIQLESNGVYFKAIDKVQSANPHTHFVVSPKAHEINGYSAGLMKNLGIRLSDSQLNAYLKVLVGSQPPYDVLPPLDDFADEFKQKNVYLSPITVYRKPTQGEVASAWDPELVDQYQTAANHAKAAQLCMDYNFRLSMQQHNFCLLP